MPAPASASWWTKPAASPKKRLTVQAFGRSGVFLVLNDFFEIRLLLEFLGAQQRHRVGGRVILHVNHGARLKLRYLEERHQPLGLRLEDRLERWAHFERE